MTISQMPFGHFVERDGAKLGAFEFYPRGTAPDSIGGKDKVTPVFTHPWLGARGMRAYELVQKVGRLAHTGDDGFVHEDEDENAARSSLDLMIADARDVMAMPMGDAGDTDAAIKYMADRFLSWRLPENFSPDCGISFKATFNDHLPTPSKYDPTGTNLFDYTQATAMIRHMTEGLMGLGGARINAGGHGMIVVQALSPEKREELLEAMASQKGGGVILVSGDGGERGEAREPLADRLGRMLRGYVDAHGISDEEMLRRAKSLLLGERPLEPGELVAKDMTPESALLGKLMATWTEIDGTAKGVVHWDTGPMVETIETLSYLRRQTEDEENAEKCIACLIPMKPGDKYYSDQSGGVGHAACFGTDPEGFCDVEGEPLKPGAPIPEPGIWEP